jgi:hypothetical protein
MGRSFGWYRKNRSPLSQQVWYDKDPAPSSKQRPKFCSPSPAIVTSPSINQSNYLYTVIVILGDSCVPVFSSSEANVCRYSCPCRWFLVFGGICIPVSCHWRYLYTGILSLEVFVYRYLVIGGIVYRYLVIGGIWITVFSSVEAVVYRYFRPCRPLYSIHCTWYATLSLIFD